MPLYIKDNPDWFNMSLKSILAQTAKPDEIFITCDGAVSPELEAVLQQYAEQFPELFRIYRIPDNVGLGVALARSVPLCRNELIARMDADDFAVPERCEKQLDYCADNGDKNRIAVGLKHVDFAFPPDEAVVAPLRFLWKKMEICGKDLGSCFQ